MQRSLQIVPLEIAQPRIRCPVIRCQQMGHLREGSVREKLERLTYPRRVKECRVGIAFMKSVGTMFFRFGRAATASTRRLFRFLQRGSQSPGKGA